MVKYLTPEGLEKMKQELEYLEKTERKEVAEKIRHAASYGDLKENASYTEAKEQQGFLEAKIRELRDILSQAEVIEKGKGNIVQMGSKVVLDSQEGKETYQIVGPEEADIVQGRISFKSSLGEALLGKKKGEAVKFNTPGGLKQCKIIDVE